MANVRLSFADWKGEAVAPATYQIPVVDEECEA
jgi:hypothetical protein